MLLKLLLPVVDGAMGRAKIVAVHAKAGDALRPRARLFDFTMGLDTASAHDCPTITTYRLTVSEKAWLRRIDIAADDFVTPGDCVALLGSEDGEPIDGEPERAARVSIAAILQPMAW